MHKILAALALILALGGTASAIIEWTLNMFVLEQVDWSGPFQILANIVWLTEGVGIGGGVICLAAAMLIPNK